MLSVITISFGAKQDVRRDAKGTRLEIVDMKIMTLVLVQVYDVEWVWFVAHDFLRGFGVITMLIPAAEAPLLPGGLFVSPFGGTLFLLFRRDPADFRACFLSSFGDELRSAAVPTILSAFACSPSVPHSSNHSLYDIVNISMAVDATLT